MAQKFDRFQTLLNNYQQSATTFNRVCKRCVCFHGALNPMSSSSRDVHSKGGFHLNICVNKRTFSSHSKTSGTYHLLGKPEIPVGKSNCSRHAVWEASENMGCELMRRNFPALLSFFGRFGYTFPTLPNFIVLCSCTRFPPGWFV